MIFKLKIGQNLVIKGGNYKKSLKIKILIFKLKIGQNLVLKGGNYKKSIKIRNLVIKVGNYKKSLNIRNLVIKVGNYKKSRIGSAGDGRFDHIDSAVDGSRHEHRHSGPRVLVVDGHGALAYDAQQIGVDAAGAAEPGFGYQLVENARRKRRDHIVVAVALLFHEPDQVQHFY